MSIHIPEGTAGARPGVDLDSVLARLADLEQRVLVHEAAARSRRRFARGAAGVSALGAVLALGSWTHQALSQATCTQTLPAPLTTFCANTPAIAKPVNDNFKQL